jgi:serine/threonine protein kinase
MSETNTALSDDPLIGSHIDSRYTVQRVLGQGGMGVVYEGVHDELGRSVAIKVLNAAWATDRTAVERFLREARTASSFSHANIVDVMDLGRLADGRPYLVMPKIVGTDLAALLEETGPQPAKRVAELLRGVASALDLMHVRSFVHRDIKPENLMYVVHEDGSETVMLLDFGIAAAMSNEPRLTRQGAIFGTPAYMPPEVCAGSRADAHADVYALAVVAFELIAGVLPFSSDNVMQIMSMKLVGDAPSLAQLTGQEFPPELESVIARGLARDPQHRYDSAGAFIAALQQATDYAPVSWRTGVMRSPLRSDEHLVGSLGATARGTPPAWSQPSAAAPGHGTPPSWSQPSAAAPVRGTPPAWSQPSAAGSARGTPPAWSQPSAAAQANVWSTELSSDPAHEFGAGLRASERLRRRTMAVRNRTPWGRITLAVITLAVGVVFWVHESRTAPKSGSSAANALPSLAPPIAAAEANGAIAPAGPNAVAPMRAGGSPGDNLGVRAPTAAGIRQPLQRPSALGISNPPPSAAIPAAPRNTGLGYLSSAENAATPGTHEPSVGAAPADGSNVAAPAQPNLLVPPVPNLVAPSAALKAPEAVKKPSISAPKPSTAPLEAAAPPAPEPVLTLKEMEPEPEPDAPDEPAKPSAAELTQSGTSALLRGEVNRAVDLLRAATQADPSHALAWRSLGLALERAGNATEAIDAYTHYVSLVPSGTQADMVRDRMQLLRR